jgi:hypothetical protein
VHTARSPVQPRSGQRAARSRPDARQGRSQPSRHRRQRCRNSRLGPQRPTISARGRPAGPVSSHACRLAWKAAAARAPLFACCAARHDHGESKPCAFEPVLTAGELWCLIAIGAPPAPAGPRPPASEQASPRAGATIVRVEDRGGFDWADAGIGAAGGVALSVLSAGLALLISERRERQREPKEG